MRTPRAQRKLYLHHDPHGERKDYYYWLRDSAWPNVQNEEILDYLNQENLYSNSIISQNIKEHLFDELKSRIQENDSSVPYFNGGYYYYSYIKQGQQYWIHARKKLLEDIEEEIILDENQLSENHIYMNVADIKISPDHQYVAYSADFLGNERYGIYVQRIADKAMIDQFVNDSMGQIEWDNNNLGFFYSPGGQFWRADKIYYHKLSSANLLHDKLVYHESDLSFVVKFYKSSSKKYIFFASVSSTTSEYHFIESANPDQAPKLIAIREENKIYEPVHHGEFFYIRNNDENENFAISLAPIDSNHRSNWKSYIQSSADYIKKVVAYNGYLVINASRHGLTVIKIVNILSGALTELDFEDQTYQVNTIQTTFESAALRYSYSSLIKPTTVFEYNFVTGQKNILKTQQVSVDFDSDNYKLKRLFAISSDGVEIPISILYHQTKTKLDGTDPLYLYGYGSYGISVPDSFRTTIFSLVDRGFIYAIAHIRGGDELGKQWHESAKFLNKKKTFTDFIEVSDFLIAKQYTGPKRIVIHGGSAGGLLVGACINMRADLYHAAIAEVPFVDTLTTMLDESLPLTPYEFKEWGDPKNQTFYDYMKSYSPYDNVTSQEYPHLLVTAGLTDPRVGYWEPAKWVALLRHLKIDNNLLLFRTEMSAGHSGPSGRFEDLKELSSVYAFILQVFQISI